MRPVLENLAPSAFYRIIWVPWIHDRHRLAWCSASSIVPLVRFLPTFSHNDWLTVLREGVSVPLEKIPQLLVSHTSHAHTGAVAETVSHGLA